MKGLLRLGLGSFVLLGACGQAAAPSGDDFGYKGTGIAFGVAPLTLDALGDACYSFAVVNGASELVVGRGPSVNGLGASGLPITGAATGAVCASRFGNTTGGDIAYVAPCDADEPVHSVHIWIEALCAAGQTGENCDEIQPYVDPCPGPKGCELSVLCVENADTPVTFNFTIMGQADQGFFDLAVNFEDIFCSAKLDTCYGSEPFDADEDAITLLFDGSQTRAPTAVLAFACTAGAGTDDGTYLHTGNVTVVCDEGTTTLDLSTVTSEGNQTTIDGLYWAAYFGSEALSGAAGSWNKEYFNVAITGFGTSCDVSWTATASDGSLPGAGTTGGFNSYPVVTFGPTSVTDADGAWLCSQNPVNGEDSDVNTDFVDCTLPGDCLGGPCVSWQNGVALPCDATPPPPRAVPLYPSYRAGSPFAFDKIVEVAPTNPVTVTQVTTGSLQRSYTMDRMDLIHDQAADRIIANNATGVMETSPLRVSVFTNVSLTAAPAVTEYSTAGNWSATANIQKPGNLYIANGFVTSGGVTYLLAAQAGAWGPPPVVEGMHFFSLRLEGTAIVVTRLGTVIPNNSGNLGADFAAMIGAWNKVKSNDFRNFWLRSDGRAVLTGPGLVPSQSPSKFFTNTFSTDLVAGTFNATPTYAVDAGTQRSFYGFYADGLHYVYTRATTPDPANPDKIILGVGNITSPTTIEEYVPGVAMGTGYQGNFGTFDPASGLVAGLWMGTNTISWRHFGLNPTNPDMGFVPADVLNFGAKYLALATFH